MVRFSWTQPARLSASMQQGVVEPRAILFGHTTGGKVQVSQFVGTCFQRLELMTRALTPFPACPLSVTSLHAYALCPSSIPQG